MPSDKELTELFELEQQLGIPMKDRYHNRIATHVISHLQRNTRDHECGIEFTCTNCWKVCLTANQNFCGECGTKLKWNLVRCGCGGGECWPCYKDMIDEYLREDPDHRMCTCKMEQCGVCNYYKSIGKS